MATREERTIHVEIISAKDLKHVKEHGKQDAFAVAYIYKECEKSTEVDHHGGLNPVWNTKLDLTMSERHLQRGHAVMTVVVRYKTLLGSHSLGEARIRLPNLPAENPAPQHLTLELKLKSGEKQGLVNVALALGEKRAVPAYEPPTWEMGVGSDHVSLFGHPNGFEGYTYTFLAEQDVM